LTDFMGFIVKHLRWLLHKLSHAQLATREQMANEFLKITDSAKRQS
jgi:hypothetical protein